EKTISELKDKVTEEQKKKVTDASNAAKEALKSNDLAKIKQETENLKNVLQEIGGNIYGQGQAGAPGQGPGGPENPGGSEPGKGDDVVDGKYEKK
ncbi:molecular chaperone DnaK, partial [Candidatus Micrarchaeota archaeon]|nr:molecular chaperone DnaK [Candidatus Micrarchaeota archaeon]